jgi:hypothetical protein
VFSALLHPARQPYVTGMRAKRTESARKITEPSAWMISRTIANPWKNFANFGGIPDNRWKGATGFGFGSSRPTPAGSIIKRNACAAGDVY